MRILLVFLVFALAACSPGGHSARPRKGHSASPPGAPAPVTSASPPVVTSPPGKSHRVTFAIRGHAGDVTVSYTAPDGRERRAVVSPPWSTTFTVPEGRSVNLSARGTGDLTCTLTVDGDLVKSASSSGSSAVVDCGDSVGF